MSKFVSRIAVVCVISVAAEWPATGGAEPSASNPVPVVAEGATPRAVPYTWRNVAIGGGGFVTGIIFHPRQKDLMYARTDVGGAYRWESAAQRWIPITDWIGAEDVNLTGIESLAVDPSDANRVYLAAGTYSRHRAAVLCSDDRGKTFRRTDVPFTMGANEAGRFNGERLAVDPNTGEILFFGSRHDGLWRSSDRGVSWQSVEGFPRPGSEAGSAAGGGGAGESRFRFGFSQQSVGIVCVVFDPSSGSPGQPTPRIYAAVSTTGTNLFRSVDGGVHWEAVPGQPLGFRPNHLVVAPDGIFYLSYGREAGPNTMTDGGIWKWNGNTGDWTDITPVRPASSNQPFGYGAVAVDRQHPATIMATTFCHWKEHDEIFRSTNGGVAWMQLWRRDTRWDHSSAPYTASHTPHWMGDIKINPFASDEVLFTTGYGIWRCVNATQADSGRPTRWVFLNGGLEETVPLALISPPEGARLLSGLGDIDGFRHEHLTLSPAETFDGPRFGNTEDLAFAGRKPQVIARTGVTRSRGQTRAAYSLNGGRSWKAFGSEPANSAGGGSIAVSADGKTVVWTPRRSLPHYSVDHGQHWFACEGLSAGIRVVADSANQTRFYAYNARQGVLFVSTNGAAGFVATPASIPISEGFAGGFGGGGGDGAMLYSAPGDEGDLWLAFRTNGLFHSTNGGLSFNKLENVRQANSLGFGKAVAGKEYPALYLAGRIDQLTALFRSDDLGRSWVRINDDQHQFGWINHVTGDPRIYGRVYFGTGGRGIIYGEPERRADDTSRR
jgi:hypothetical protein